MRSGTSYFNGTIFKKTVLRFWPVWAAYSVIWFVSLPLNALMMLRLDADAYSGMTDGHMKNFAEYTVQGLSDLSLGMAVIFGVLAAMAVCSHLYNARSANLFGALPVRREGLFLTHYLAGLSFLIVPTAVVFVLTLLIEAAGGGVYLPGLLFWLGVTCGECLFFYSMAVFCGMFTGHLLALPAFYAIFNALAAALYYLLEWVFNAFYYGFDGFGADVAEVVRWLAPVWNLAREVDTFPFPTLSGMDVVAIYAAVGVALTVGAFFLYRVRRLESAGDVVSVKPMRPVFKYSVAVCAGLFFGMVTAQMVNMHEPGLMVSMLVWAVIGYFAAQMLLDKSFKVFHKWKGAAAVAGAFVVLFAVVGFDLTGFETWVPHAADVKSVHMNSLSAVNFADGGDWAYVDVDNPQQIELVTTLHRAAVDQRSYQQKHEDVSSSLTLEYTLNNGSTVSRRYTVWLDPAEVDQEGTAAWAAEKLYQDRDLYWKIYGFDTLEAEIAKGGRLDTVTFSHYETRDDGWSGPGDVFGYGADARAVLDAVEEDFMAGRIGVRSVTDPRAAMGGEPLDQLSFRVMDPNTGDRLAVVEIALQETATSTLAELKRLEANLDNESIRGAFEEWLNWEDAA